MTGNTWTPEHAERLKTYLERPGYVITKGMGTRGATCSMGAIRVAWDNTLSFRAPPCMSDVVAAWIFCIQDQCPEDIRNSDEWKEALQLAPYAGPDRDKEYRGIIMDWVFDTVLPPVMVAMNRDYKEAAWAHMLEERTAEAAWSSYSDIFRSL